VTPPSPSTLPAVRPPAEPVEPVQVGVIGVGRIGRLHAKLLAHEVPGAAIACVFDRDESAALGVARELGVSIAPDVASMLSDPTIEAVAICSSTDTHAELITAAARAGKAIFCEKPISLDLAAVDAALSEVHAARVPFQIGFNRRFDPAHRAVRDAVAAGQVGRPHLVRITSRDPAPPGLDYVRVSGGIFLDMTIHDFDMARFVVGSEVVSVTAHGAVRITPELSELGDVDTAVVTLVHDNGCLTTIDNSRRAVYGFDQRVEAFGDKGMVTSVNPTVHTGVRYTQDGAHLPPLPFFFLDRYIPSYVHQWRAFVDVVRGTAPSPVPPRDARAPLVIGLAAWRSLRDERTVALAEIDTALTSQPLAAVAA
jgi:myo-inositol 2-dehydrogenase / D-chiro-inositol 1-dehydrogenase